MNILKDHLNRIAIDYHTNESIPDIHIENTCQIYFIEWLKRQIPDKSSVLELGYGDGIVTNELSNIDCELTLIEGATTLVDIAQRKHPNINCVDTLFEDYTPTKLFDVILASHVLEHVDNPVDIIKLMSKWLKPNGKIIIVVPNMNSIHRQLAVIMGLQPALDTLSERDLLVGHQRVYSISSLSDHIRQGGLIPQQSKGFFLKSLPNSMMLQYSPELLVALNEISNTMPSDILANIAIIASKSN